MKAVTTTRRGAFGEVASTGAQGAELRADALGSENAASSSTSRPSRPGDRGKRGLGREMGCLRAGGATSSRGLKSSCQAVGARSTQNGTPSRPVAGHVGQWGVLDGLSSAYALSARSTSS